MSKRRVYLDWNSTTPPLPEVVDAVAEALRGNWGNPASLHGTGRQARAALEGAREHLARLSGVESRGVVFTSGGTEANNWALTGDAPLVTSRLEHPSVTKFAEAAERAGRAVHWLDVEPSGVVGLASLERALHHIDGSAVVAVMAANHETGVVQPLAEVACIAHAHGSRLHVDAVQWVGKGAWEALDVADSIAVAAHKIRGPKGIGALLLRGVAPPRLLEGGAQERGLRAGTQSAALASGFATALVSLNDRASRHAALEPLRDRLETAFRGVAVVNGTRPRLPHVSNLSFEGFPGPELVAALDLEGIAVSSGSACSAGTAEPSTVIQAMLGRERAETSVRFSMGDETSQDDVDFVIAALRRVLG